MRIATLCVLVIMLSLVFGTAAPTIADPKVPLPGDLRIVPPGSDVPPEVAAFSGKWSGLWGPDLAGILVVEEISVDPTPRAIVIYAWGEQPRFNIRPGWTRVRGVFVKGELRLALSTGVQAAYRMRSDGSLDGTYERGGQITRGTFKRVTE